MSQLTKEIKPVLDNIVMNLVSQKTQSIQ